MKEGDLQQKYQLLHVKVYDLLILKTNHGAKICMCIEVCIFNDVGIVSSQKCVSAGVLNNENVIYVGKINKQSSIWGIFFLT